MTQPSDSKEDTRDDLIRHIMVFFLEAQYQIKWGRGSKRCLVLGFFFYRNFKIFRY